MKGYRGGIHSLLHVPKKSFSSSSSTIGFFGRAKWAAKLITSSVVFFSNLAFALFSILLSESPVRFTRSFNSSGSSDELFSPSSLGALRLLFDYFIGFYTPPRLYLAMSDTLTCCRCKNDRFVSIILAFRANEVALSCPVTDGLGFHVALNDIYFFILPVGDS